MNKKRVLLLTLVISLLLSLISCSEKEKEGVVSNRDFNKEEVEACAKVLIEKSLPLNEILFGSGLDFYDEEEEGKGIYKKATKESLEKYGVKSVADIKRMASEVFSSQYVEKKLNGTDIFSSGTDGENIKFYARYFDETDEEGNTSVYVNSVYEYGLNNKYEYITEPRAVGSIGELVVVKATVRATMQDKGNGEVPKSKN